MRQYIIAHDLGTSGNKATLYRADGSMVKSTVYSYDLYTAPGGCAEQNADDWWRAVCETTKTLLDAVPPAEIAAVSFSGQMMGCLCVDDTGTPLRNAIIWADMRSSEQESALRQRISDRDFYHCTGHRLSSSYSLTKLMWIRENEPDVYAKTYKMLNAKDYIILKLTGKYVTEPSDASSTCMMDLNRQTWSEDLLRIAELDPEKLPEILRSVDIAGGVTKEASALTGLLEGTPVVCGGGDGCCAAVGTGAVKEGVANCCLGTSSWISLASRKPVCDDGMTVFNFAHIVPGYILPCGTMQTGGGSLSWASKIFYEGEKSDIYSKIEREVSQSPVGAEGLLFLPYLMGERSPRWNSKAKGAFVGMTMSHTRGDMLRAVMEGVGYNLDLILKTFQAGGCDPKELVLVGGGARNLCWQQILSDVLGLPMVIPDNLEEATSMGAAITAGVGVGLFANFDAAQQFIHVAQRRTPNPATQSIYTNAKRLFDEAYFANVPVFENM